MWSQNNYVFARLNVYMYLLARSILSLTCHMHMNMHMQACQVHIMSYCHMVIVMPVVLCGIHCMLEWVYFGVHPNDKGGCSPPCLISKQRFK